VSVDVRGAGAHDGEWFLRSCNVMEALPAALETKTNGEGEESLQNLMKYVANPAVSQS
jgi:hypothetical protein